MTNITELLRSWTDAGPLATLKHLLESFLFRSPEPAPVSTWRLLIDPPMPYWVTLFSQACRWLSLLILLPIFIITALDFAGYAVFRTLGLHRRRVRIQRASGVKAPLGRSNSRKKPRVYQNDKHRPTDRSNIPSIVQAPLLSPGTYDAETLLRQRARSLSSASGEEVAAWVASGGQTARLNSVSKGASEDSDAGSPGDTDVDTRDYFARAKVGVDGPLGLADTDVESGTESGIDSPRQQFGGKRRRGLSGGLNFTPVSPSDQTPTGAQDADVVSLASSDSPTSSQNGDRLGAGKGSSNMSSSWIGVEQDELSTVTPPVDPKEAAAAAELEPRSPVFTDTAS